MANIVAHLLASSISNMDQVTVDAVRLIDLKQSKILMQCNSLHAGAATMGRGVKSVTEEKMTRSSSALVG